jgi:hypothetical protein
MYKHVRITYNSDKELQELHIRTAVQEITLSVQRTELAELQVRDSSLLVFVCQCVRLCVQRESL